MIGLVDYDLQTCQSIYLHPPNIEIMKLATYYRVEEQHFCRLVELNDNTEDLTMYDKIFFFSEADVMPSIPSKFLRANNVIYGGTAFTNGIYIPFKKEIIDYTLAKPAIYKEYLKQRYQDGIASNVISHILDDSYYRQYAGNNQLPLPAILPKKRLWVYDTNFFQKGWKNYIEQAIERKCSSINTIHPIICKKLSQYLEIRAIPKIARSNSIILDIDIPLTDVYYLFKEYQNVFLEDITPNSSVYLSIGGNLKTNFQYYKDLIYKLNLLYSFWSKQIPIKLKYIPPYIGTVCNISNLLKAIELWSNSKNHDWTINDKISRKKMRHPPIEYIEKTMLLKFYPNAADLFKQSYNDLFNRRVWKI